MADETLTAGSGATTTDLELGDGQKLDSKKDDDRKKLDRKKDDDRKKLDRKNDAERLFPLLDADGLKEYIIPLASAALLGIAAINVLSSAQGQDPLASGAKHTAMCKFLIAMPYSLFPAGLAGLGAAMGATRRPRLLGFASGFLFSELIFLIIMGGVVSFVRVDASPWIVIPVTGGILVALVYIWLLMCAYPKCLTYLCCCCKAKFTSESGQQTCNICGAATVDGVNPNAATDGAVPCSGCGGVRTDALTAPEVSEADNC